MGKLTLLEKNLKDALHLHGFTDEDLWLIRILDNDLESGRAGYSWKGGAMNERMKGIDIALATKGLITRFLKMGDERSFLYVESI